MNSKIWLSSPAFTGEETTYIQEAFDQGIIGNSGENLDVFESEIKTQFSESREVLATSSGTAAIHLALQLLGVKENDEVLCQSNTFIATANPIRYQKATPIFIDSEKETWNMSPDFLEQAIKERLKVNKKPKAIIYVHLYGMPAKALEIKKIASKYEIPLIEDAAEAFGSQVEGRSCGTLGDISILSFNSNKIITTSGGGALIVNSKELRDKAFFLATQAKDKAPYYQHSQIGYNYRMSNVNAGIGRAQIKALSSFIEKRRAINTYYKKELSKVTEIIFHEEPNATYLSNYWLTACQIKKDPLAVIEELNKNNIEARSLWKPLHLQPIYKSSLFFGDGTSERLFNSGICLPSSSTLTKEAQERIIKTLTTILKRN